MFEGSPTSNAYFDRLQFNAKLMQSWVAKYIQSIRFVILLILTICLVGVAAYINLPKRLNPEVKIPIVTIVTTMPGASPQDMETLVTIPLEDKLRGLKGVDQATSVSQENVSVVTLQFVSSVNRDKAKDDVQSAITGVQLPNNSSTPQVKALDFEDVPIWQFALTSTGDTPDLMAAADALKDRIGDLAKVDRVETTGLELQEIVVQADPQKLAQYGLNPAQLAQMVRTARASYPAGNLQTETNTFAVTIDRSLENIQDIRELQLNINGRPVPLGDLATVSERSKLNQQRTLIGSHDQPVRRAVVFSVYKTSTSDITDAGKVVKTEVDKFIAERNGSIQVTTLLNTSEEISKQFTDLLGEFRTTIILVFAVLLLFLGLRQAIISSLTVPLTFLSAFFFMQLTGMTINFLSMFAFLLALGLLVDDTIVVVSAMTSYYRSGKFTPVQTGILVWRDTIIPIWSTTITTIWAFVPLLLSSGIIGEFIKPIPIVVTVTMISSTAIAVLVTLPLMIVLLEPHIPRRVYTMLKILAVLFAAGVVAALSFGTPVFIPVLIIYVLFTVFFRRTLPAVKTRLRGFWARITQKNTKKTKASNSTVMNFFNKIKDRGIIDVEGLAAKYERLIMRILSSKASRRKVLIAVILYAVFSFALLPLGFVKNEFFPKADQNELFVQLELPTGSTLRQSEAAAQPILSKLIAIPQTEFVTAEVGKRSATQGAGNISALSSSTNTVAFSIRLVDKDDRNVSSTTIADQLRKDFTGYTDGKLSVIEESGGPPAGADIQMTLLGDDLKQLDGYANQLMDFLKQQPGVTNVTKSIGESTSALTFEPDAAKLVQYGVTTDALGASLRMYASGFPLDSIAFTEGKTDTTDVVFKVQAGQSTPQGLNEVQVFTPQGQAVPLLSLGKLVARANPNSITHQEFKRSLTVSAAITGGQSAPETNKKLESFANTLKLPAGYSWKTGGINEENAKSIQSILLAMLLSAVLILITMVIQFGSFRQAVIVLIVIPLAVSSVFLAFALTGTPLSFPALIGVLSLFGIVVTNSMFIVDKINLNQKEGMGFKESIANAGASRMEPIILTKLCTVFGLLPITIADPLWRGLGGAIISGLLVASTIMLLFIPVLYYNWMQEEKPVV